MRARNVGGPFGQVLRLAAASALFAGAISGVARAQLPASPRPLPTLTHADQIRRLSPEQASLGYPVLIRGVITMDVPAPDFFVQDATAGIYVEGSVSRRYPHLLSELVEIEGVTGPGKFAPVVREVKSRVLGKGVLPRPQLFLFSELANGQRDSQWVQVRGIVRSAAIDRTSWQEPALAMRVASEGGAFNVRVPITHEQDFSSWVDSEVLIEGVCGSLYNANRQLTGILFYVPRLSFIRVEAPSTEVPLSELLRFAPAEGARHRVRVRGVVGYQQQGNALFLQNQGKGLRVLTQQSTPLEIGDVVDVLGFPATGDSAPILEDAIFHRLGHDKVPEAVKLNLDKPWEQFDGAVVTTDAKLWNRQLQADGLRLMLQRGDLFFDATAPPGIVGERLLSIPLNSDVQVTGICLVRSGGLWQTPQSFRMLLRSAQDIVVRATPSWWNLRHTLWVLGITGFVLVVVIVWVVVLRRRLQEQMAVIRQKLRSGAVLEERNRIARELHDTLEQELAGITMQLDLAVDCFLRAPGVAQHALETARDMSRHSMIGARRSVWDLRCQLLENGDLVSALAHIVEPLLPRAHTKVDFKIQGTPLRLPGPVEMNLLRIGQEAVANAVRHGRARQVSIELRYSPASVCLTVTDDGQGFASGQSSPIGHFGLLDMRERAQSMGSHLAVVSAPGCGACISVEVSVHPSEAIDEELKGNSYSGR
ncbi:MAG TPA: sensor histidine kinase [Candidatus Dormibacteraeota bacterium]|nr:sensor histidine kinase [Candidatus Dormibacteraeota bacterium]